nr:hypothetical protein [Tanacetum cinerariifolium]
MATIIKQQTTLDESLVPSTQSKEATLQVVYDVLRNSSLFKAFQVTADVPEIYMQEFWATAKLHHNSIGFKIDTRKSTFDLEAFREMLHISPRIPYQPFADLPTEEEILDFLRFLGHSHDIRYLTDVNGFYHRINIDFAYLIWEDFVYQVEHKSQKRSNEMNYPRFMKVIIDYFMTRKPSISRQNRINWHYVRDDALFLTIKVVLRHQTTQQYGAILPIELTTAEIRNNDALFLTIKVVLRHQTTQQYGAMLPIELTTAEIRNSKAYKEYHACAMGEAAPKPKASARKKKGDSASSTTPPTPPPTTTVESAPRLSATAKGKQPSRATTHVEPTDVQRIEAEQLKLALKRSRETHISQQSGSGVPDVPFDDSEKELSWNSSDDEDVGSHEEGKRSDESDDDRDEGSDDDSEETVKADAVESKV